MINAIPSEPLDEQVSDRRARKPWSWDLPNISLSSSVN